MAGRPSITAFDGVGEVGGNKLLLDADGVQLFFDFGTNFNRRSQFFEEYLTPRAARGLLDMLATGTLPPLQGIYRDDLSPPGLDVWSAIPGVEPKLAIEPQGILVSHAHLDHCGAISFLRPDIPIYTTAMSALIAKAVQDSGKSDSEHEVCYATPRVAQGSVLQTSAWNKVKARRRPFVIVDRPIPEAMSAFWGHSAGARGLEGPSLGADTTIGGLPIRCFPVDHSIYGAAAFAVETSMGWVAYTGDLRLHGTRGKYTEGFAQEAAKLRPQVLLCEGTYIDHATRITEEEVFDAALKAVREAKGLVIADFGPRNVERLVTFLHVAHETSRYLAILPKDAYLLETMTLADPSIPVLSSEVALRIYDEAKASLSRWEREIREQNRGELVSSTEVRQHQRDYILCLSFFDLNELPDLQPEPGSVYIYSTSEPHNEEERIDLSRLHNWLGYFGVRLVGDPERGERGFHSSGHIPGPELVQLIEEIDPKMVIPIHTELPWAFLTKLGGKVAVHLPERGVPIPLE
ncbi:MAG: exonuclease [Chloroflexi bacterium]|nr:exonuclease [Chloroflexota bacterium]